MAENNLSENGAAMVYSAKPIPPFMKPIRKIAKAVLQLFTGDPEAYLKNVTGVIHIGGHIAEERELYAKNGLDVVWIEPVSEPFQKLKSNISGFPRQKAYQYLITDKDDETYEFHVANNFGASSSIFGIGELRDIWPHIEYVRTIQLRSTTFAAFAARENIDISKYNAMVLDTQGSELLVLKGAAPLLNGFKYIKLEVADFESYVGCCQLKDIEAFLLPLGFREFSRKKFAARKAGGSYFDILYMKSDS